VRGSEVTSRIAIGAGERSLAMAEELTFCESFGDGCAVDRNEGALAPADAVDGSGRTFLAAAALAFHDDWQIGRCRPTQFRDCRGERRAAEHPG
jgi:hypothetical protein